MIMNLRSGNRMCVWKPLAVQKLEWKMSSIGEQGGKGNTKGSGKVTHESGNETNQTRTACQKLVTVPSQLFLVVQEDPDPE